MASQKTGRSRQRAAPRAKRGAAKVRHGVEISARIFPRVLLIAALALLACHTVMSIYHYQVEELPWLVFQLFDLDQENNLPTWFAAFLLSSSSALLWMCAHTKSAEGDRWSRHWYVLAVGFLLMSLDEVAGIHETVNSMIEVTWAVPGGIAALLVCLAFIPFLLDLPRRTALRFVLASAVYLLGVVAVEIVGNSMVLNGFEDTLKYEMYVIVEEGLEMIGVILFIHTLLHYMSQPVSDEAGVSDAQS
jgi:hypothetical protein